VRCGAVSTYPQNTVPGLKKTIVMVPEIAGFGGAAGGIVFGVEVQHQFASFEFRQGADLAVLVLGLEGWGLITHGGSVCHECGIG